MEQPTEKQMASLPQWASRRIKSLENKVAGFEGFQAEQRGAPETAHATFHRYQGATGVIPEGCTVYFKVGTHNRDIITIQLKRDSSFRTTKKSHLHIAGDSRVVIHPQASNCFDVELAE